MKPNEQLDKFPRLWWAKLNANIAMDAAKDENWSLAIYGIAVAIAEIAEAMMAGEAAAPLLEKLLNTPIVYSSGTYKVYDGPPAAATSNPVYYRDAALNAWPFRENKEDKDAGD